MTPTSPAPADPDAAESQRGEPDSSHHSSRFRFKRRHESSRSSRHHHHDHHRRKRRRTSPRPEVDLDPDSAFRESLFDAMADDEGAAFWEGVYGQPVHTYVPPSDAKGDPSDADGGEIHKMTDEEYVSYVRARMWEKTHEHIAEERRRREEARKENERERRERKRHADGLKRGDEDFRERMEESLKTGMRRKARQAWEAAWKVYGDRWERLLARSSREDGDGGKREEEIPWPTKSGTAMEVEKGTVEDFFKNSTASDSERKIRDMLKKERVRWHPDKMQQRFGDGNLDRKTLQHVTAVFQIIDTMYSRLPK